MIDNADFLGLADSVATIFALFSVGRRNVKDQNVRRKKQATLRCKLIKANGIRRGCAWNPANGFVYNCYLQCHWVPCEAEDTIVGATISG